MRKRRLLLIIPLGLVGLCLAVLGAFAISNLSLPTQSKVVDRLSEEQKALMLEATHLRTSLGAEV